eukprot:5093185-Amphidinium_carterae.1
MLHRGGGHFITDGPVNRGSVHQVYGKVVWLKIPVTSKEDGSLTKAGDRAHDFEKDLPVQLGSLLVSGVIAIH